MESSSGVRTEGPFDPLLLKAADKCKIRWLFHCQATLFNAVVYSGIEKLTVAACKALARQSGEYVHYPQVMSHLSMVLMELDGHVKRLIGVSPHLLHNLWLVRLNTNLVLSDGARNTPTHSVKSKNDPGA